MNVHKLFFLTHIISNILGKPAYVLADMFKIHPTTASKTGVGKLRPGGRMWPSGMFYAAC